MRDYGWQPTVLTGPFHYGATCAPLDGVKVVGRVRPSLSQPIAAPKAWKTYARKLLVPDPYVARWLPLALMQSRNLIREDRFDAILSTGPVHTCHLIALTLSRHLRKPWVVDFRDPWVDNPGAPPRPPWIDSLNRRLEARVVRSGTLVTSTSPVHLEEMRKRYPDCADRLVFLPNGFDPHDLEGAKPIRFSQSIFNLVHAGNVYGSRTALLERLLEAFIQLPADIHLQLLGAKCEEVDDLVERYQLAERVKVTLPQPHEVALGCCLGADMLVLIQGGRFAIPGKVYEYAATGRPILHIGPNSSSPGQVIAQWKIGRSVERVEDIVAVILKSRDEIRNSFSLSPVDLSRYSRQHLTAELVGHLNRLIYS